MRHVKQHVLDQQGVGLGKEGCTGGSELQLCLLFGQVAQRTGQNLRLNAAHGGFAFDGSCFPSASSTVPGAGTAGNIHSLAPKAPGAPRSPQPLPPAASCCIASCTFLAFCICLFTKLTGARHDGELLDWKG